MSDCCGPYNSGKPDILGLGLWSLESGVWSLESGVWSLESGVWSLESLGVEHHPAQSQSIPTTIRIISCVTE